MSSKVNKYAVRKLKSSYISTIISISLVLFMLGLLGILVLKARRLSDYVKENIQLSVMLKDNAKEAEVDHFQKILDKSRYVKTTEYISKEEAAKRLTNDLGEDFVKFLGYNPLLASIDIYLHADYANPDSLKWIETEINTNQFVREIYYQKSLVNVINENMKTISLVILIISGVLSLIAIALINNTIRLALYSQRFLIKTMQLVGATQGFIRKPFMLRSMMHGIYGSITAIAVLTLLLYFSQRQFPELFQGQDLRLFGSLFGTIIIIGIFISLVSTYFAMRKYLRQKLEDLYF